MIWFTADQHFGHTNIIKFCGRPFIDADHMAKNLVDNHNSLVKPGEHVYHLGDVTFQLEAEWYMGQLNGIHHLILGNHDHRNFHKGTRPGVYASIQQKKEINWNTYSFFLSHYSHRVWNKSHFGAIHLYGHSHGTIPDFGRSMDVGVDTNDFYPYSADQIVKRMEGVDHQKVDHHYKAFKDCKEPVE
jgi:calcineurin-like phosphoesterase family protein